jgi:mannosyltransferase
MKTLQAPALKSKLQAIHQLSQTRDRWLPISLILLLATVLFGYRMESEGLWLDELTSIQDVDQGLLALYRENQLRPLYYLLLKVWIQFGRSDAWLRSLSVIFALISVYLLYRLGKRLLSAREGLIAALLLTVSPLFINHAQEIRMYVVSLCLGLAGTIFLADVLLTERAEIPRHRALAGWSMFRLLAILTVPLNVTLLLPDTLILFLRFRRERASLIRIALWLGVLGLLWIPSLLSVIQEVAPDSTFANHHPDAKPPGADRIVRLLKFLTVWPFAAERNAIAASFYKVFTLLVAGLMGAALIKNRSKSPALVWLCAWFVLPLCLILGFSYLSIPIWVNRYMLFVSPYLFLLLAAGFTRLWQQWKVAAVVMGMVYLIAAGGGLVNYYSVQERPDYKFNIATLEANEQPGDTLVWSYFYLKPLKHYYDGNMEVHWRPIRDVKTLGDAKTWVSQFPRSYERYWLVIEESGPLADEFETAIADTFEVEKMFEYERGSQVMLLTPKQPSKQPLAQSAASDL